MTNPDWQKVKDIFLAALDKDESEREEFLDSVCDSETRNKVGSLLKSHMAAEDFIETPAFTTNQVFDEETGRIDQRFGAYTIEREIGHGGMGAVYLARRTDGEFDQQVALKIVRQSIAESQMIERFKTERQILASLNHPNISRLLDGGVSGNREPFLAMEYIEGETITDFAKRQNLSIDAKLRLFIKVCSAVAYAHRNLVVHRDIKPSNILVTADGEPKLLDFGLAKLSQPQANGSSDQTQTAFRALTPAYASPEQLKGQPITTSSDVYSLGIVLFELLTGERPFHFEGKTLDEIIRTITASQPALPSRTSEIASPLKGDIDNIILTALRSDPERRYRSVEIFANDIERHLQGLPISARANTFKYRTGKFIKRHKVAVFAASLILFTVFAGFAATVWQSRVAARERDQAQLEQKKSEQLNSFLQTILSSASPEESGKDAKVIEVLDNAADRINTEFADQPELKVQALLTIGKTYLPLGDVDKADIILRKAYELSSEVNGVENETTSSCMMYLGVVSMNKGRFDEAQNLLSTAIETERKLVPDGRKETAYALDALGEFYVRRQDYEKARQLLLESISIYDKLSGPENADSAFVLISLGRAQSFSGDLVGAEATYRRSLSIYGQLPKPYELRIAMVQQNLGYLLVTQGKYDEAISILHEAEAAYQKKQGNALTTFFTKGFLCRAYFYKGDLDQVINNGLAGIEMGRRFKLEGNPDFTTILEYVGLSFTRKGDAKKGESMLREALKLAENALPNEVANAKGILGENLMTQKRFAEAEPLLIESYDKFNASLGDAEPHTLKAKNRVIQLYSKWDKPELAAKLFGNSHSSN